MKKYTFNIWGGIWLMTALVLLPIMTFLESAIGPIVVLCLYSIITEMLRNVPGTYDYPELKRGGDEIEYAVYLIFLTGVRSRYTSKARFNVSRALLLISLVALSLSLMLFDLSPWGQTLAVILIPFSQSLPWVFDKTVKNALYNEVKE